MSEARNSWIVRLPRSCHSSRPAADQLCNGALGAVDFAGRTCATVSARIGRPRDDEGLVTPKDIDDSVTRGIALRMPILGVMAKADFTGLPLLQQGMKNRSYTPPEVRGNSETLDKLIAEGRTGVMSGKGYFDRGDRSPEELFRERDHKLLALKQALRKIGPMERT